LGTAAERLTEHIESKDCFDVSWSELLPLQIEAAAERLNERVGAIKLLANRAETGGVKAIRQMADLVPLLFAHTAYKSYPDSWLAQGKWDRMGRWLDTLTTHRVHGIDTKDVKEIDDWIARLEATGHYLSCSSGTTGKCSILPASIEDRKFVRRQMAKACAWATGLKTNREYKMFSVSPMTANFRTVDARQSIVDAFTHSNRPFPGEAITVGQVSKMVSLRRSVAEGTARPAEVAAFEATAAKRTKAVDESLKGTVEAIIASRGEKLLFQGLTATVYQISEMVRNQGFSGKDFNPNNAICMGGGLKGAKLPPDYRERILDTFNVQPVRTYLSYSMQEINTVMPRCRVGRYHAPPWIIVLVLDETGEQLIEPGKGEIEGRAAFFDIALDGRWCGLISGDKVRVDYGKCACGHHGPTMHDEIVRYSDLAGGDKISCAGTIDAYIRGVS
jgi:hypothetical protein